MKKSELKKLIKEEIGLNNEFNTVISYLRKSIYPKLNDDEVYELNIRLKEWFNKNVT